MQKTHKIIGKARIEGTQKGYIVWVKLDTHSKAQLTNATEDYEHAVATANSIDRGRWVGRRKNSILRVYGKNISVSLR